MFQSSEPAKTTNPVTKFALKTALSRAGLLQGPVIQNEKLYFTAGVWPFEGNFLYTVDLLIDAVPPSFESVNGNCFMECNLKTGDRIRLVHMADDPDAIPIGELGRVVSVADMGDWFQVDVDWDCGRKLMLSVPPDRVSLVR